MKYDLTKNCLLFKSYQKNNNNIIRNKYFSKSFRRYFFKMVNKRRTTTEIKENCPTPSRKQATESLGLSVTKKRGEALETIQTNQTVPTNIIDSKAEKTVPNPKKEEIVKEFLIII